MISDMDAMLACVRCAHEHSYDLCCALGLQQGSFLKNKSFSVGSFVRGKSVKEELNVDSTCVRHVTLE